MRPKLLNLRIAWTLLCLTAIILLFGLWILSYEYEDCILISSRFVLRSSKGFIVLGRYDWAYKLPGRSNPIVGSLQSEVRVHYVFSVVALAAMTFFPWLARTFSLRTLLVATTLIAAMLGLMVLSLR